MKPGRKTWVESDLIHSEAFAELTGAAPLVALLFHTRRQTERVKHGHGKRDEYHVINNGKLHLTYREAAAKRVSQGRYTHALNQLVHVGILDVTHAGCGHPGDASTYALSERWREYGKPGFVPAEREKDTRHVGYQGRWTKK